MESSPLSIQAITHDLKTRLIASNVIYAEHADSTNDIAKRLADEDAAEGTVVLADEQVAGRGRLGRSWVAPARTSLLMSFILRPALLPREITRVTMVVSLSACEAVRQVTGCDARIKWPNDLLLGEKKFGGILAETQTLSEHIEYVIVGLGINVNFHATSVEGIPANATTIADELGRACPREPLARAIFENVEWYYARLCAGENLRAEWAARLATLHQPVRAQTEIGIEEGIAENVDNDGALLVRRRDGVLVRLLAGDVTLRNSN